MDKKKLIKKILFIIIFFALIIAALFSIVRYQVEGEKEIPFYIEKILITSMVDGDIIEGSQNLWDINLSQPNDIYVYIAEKNKSDETINNIIIDNFRINTKSEIGNLKILRPTGELKNLYQYSQQDYINDKIEYIGGSIDDLKILQINNKGGIIGFRAKLENIGKFTSNEEQEIIYDGTLLSKANISLDILKQNISFNITIKTNNNISYKTTITIDLPVGNLIKDGNCNVEITGLEELVFKRV